MDLTWTFVLFLTCGVVAGKEIRNVTAAEGKDASLLRGKDVNNLIVYDADEKVVFNWQNGRNTVENGSINIDFKNRSLIIRNVQKNQSQVFHIQFFDSSFYQTTVTIRLIVIEPEHQTLVNVSSSLSENSTTPIVPKKRGHWGSLFSVSLLLALLLFFLALKFGKRANTSNEPVEMNERSKETTCCVNIPDENISDSSSSDNSEDKEVESDKGLLGDSGNTLQMNQRGTTERFRKIEELENTKCF